MLAMTVFAMRQLKASTKFVQVLERQMLPSSLHSAAGSPGGQMESADAGSHQRLEKLHVEQSVLKKPQERHHSPAKTQQQQPSDTWVLHWEDIMGAS